MNNSTDTFSENREFVTFLEMESKRSGIAASVAYAALCSDDPKVFFHDLLRNGCVSWMISGLITYSETHAFFDTHYAEIEELRHDYEDSTGCTLAIPNDLKNTLAWFAFEYIAYLIADKWDLA